MFQITIVISISYIILQICLRYLLMQAYIGKVNQDILLSFSSSVLSIVILNNIPHSKITFPGNIYFVKVVNSICMRFT